MAASFYGDAVTVQTTDLTVTISVGQLGAPAPDVVLKIPPNTAKRLAIILRKHLKEYERRTGDELRIPDAFFEHVGVHPEDW